MLLLRCLTPYLFCRQEKDPAAEPKRGCHRQVCQPTGANLSLGVSGRGYDAGETKSLTTTYA